MADEPSDDDEDVHAGLALPLLGGGGGSSAAPLSDDDDEDDAPEGSAGSEHSDAELGSGLLGADAAFEVDGSAYELDPFRIAGPSSINDSAEAGPSSSAGAASAGAGKLCSKLFVGGLPYDLDDAGLIKAFSRYGKVQEASVARDERGKSRGFGFVTYVHLKGARFCMEQLGDPAVFEIGGRKCTVRFSESRGGGPAHYRMPARGQYDPTPRRSGAEAKAPGGPPAPKRLQEEGDVRLTVGTAVWQGHGGLGVACGEGHGTCVGSCALPVWVGVTGRSSGGVMC
eukprot:scaffold9354_cov108-Isochrysis_galbana.AAC.13